MASGTLPGAPRSVVAQAKDASVTVSFLEPLSVRFHLTSARLWCCLVSDARVPAAIADLNQCQPLPCALGLCGGITWSVVDAVWFAERRLPSARVPTHSFRHWRGRHHSHRRRLPRHHLRFARSFSLFSKLLVRSACCKGPLALLSVCPCLRGCTLTSSVGSIYLRTRWRSS